MVSNNHLQYLSAMGIEVWRLRSQRPELLPAEAVNETEKATHPKQTDNLPVSESQWNRLVDEVSNCRKCSLCETRTQTVFGVGNRNADWMIIGEAPGQSEDEQGEPFVGRAGQLLTEMLRAIGLKRQEVFIANILKCRPPNNRDPNPKEVEACHDFLQRQIHLIQPKIILAVGRVAAQNLLSTDKPIGKLRGSVHHLDDTPVVVLYHPAYLLRSLLEKRKAWADLKLALATYNSKKG